MKFIAVKCFRCKREFSEESMLGYRVCVDCRSSASIAQSERRSRQPSSVSARKNETVSARRLREAIAAGHDGIPDGHRMCSRCKAMLPDVSFRLLQPSHSTPFNCRRRVCLGCETKLSKSSWSKDQMKDWRLKRHFGIGLDEYRAMLEAQGGACAICGRTSDDDSMGHELAVDHNHKTGKVRGLLCRHCNIAIGKLGDCTEGVRAALKYMEERDA